MNSRRFCFSYLNSSYWSYSVFEPGKRRHQCLPVELHGNAKKFSGTTGKRVQPIRSQLDRSETGDVNTQLSQLSAPDLRKSTFPTTSTDTRSTRQHVLRPIEIRSSSRRTFCERTPFSGRCTYRFRFCGTVKQKIRLIHAKLKMLKGVVVQKPTTI